MNRKKFFRITMGASGLAFLTPSLTFSQDSPERPPQLKPEMVKEFVGLSHSSLDKVKKMYKEEPALIHCSWDWGGGDFELPIGAASHVGNTEVISFLLEKGANMNLHTACVLGKLEIVQAILKPFPEQLNARGPHGFTPLHHAIRGGDEAAEVKAYLEDLGATETQI